MATWKKCRIANDLQHIARVGPFYLYASNNGQGYFNGFVHLGEAPALPGEGEVYGFGAYRLHDVKGKLESWACGKIREWAAEVGLSEDQTAADIANWMTLGYGSTRFDVGGILDVVDEILAGRWRVM